MLHNKTVDDLLQIKEIYLEPEVRNYKRGKEILEKYKHANLIDLVDTLVDMVQEQMPYCPIRYAF